jgi:tetratricopeptide (TPR) repeat protein
MFRLAPLNKFIVGVLFVLAQTAVLSIDDLETGKKLYAEGKLDQAARRFQSILAEDPKNATAHYLLGNVYLALKHLPLAITEYQKASALDARGQVGGYSRQALGELTGLPSRSLQQSPPESNGSANNAAVRADSNSDAVLTRNSATAISTQADERTRRTSAECDAKVKAILEDGDNRLKSLEKEMLERIALNGEPVRVWVGRRHVTTYDPAAENQIIRDEYAPKMEAIKEETRKRAGQVTAFYQQKAAALEDSAIMLDKNYLKPSKGIKQSPIRTDMYVRSYETSDESSGSPVPVKAAAKSLNSLHGLPRTKPIDSPSNQPR